MEFRILGPLEVLDEDVTLPLGGAKQRALLAILLIHANRVVSTDRLIDDLWGDEPPATAANILQVYVSQLRKVIRTTSRGGNDAEALATQRPGYLLRAGPEELDLARFERLCEEGRQALAGSEPSVASVKMRSALALFRGQPLADFTFETFAQPEIERIEELHVAATEDRIEADLALSRHSELVGDLEALVRQHPLRERLRGHLMLALYRAGRQAEALQAYQEAARVLGEDLGIDPSPPLQRLHEEILRQEPSLAPPPAPAVAAHVVTAPATTAALASPISEGWAAPTPGSPEADRAILEPEDQFLPVTVLFADVVGSTTLGEHLRPDEVRALIGECVSRMSRVVEDLGGIVQAYMGDGICAYFGVPVAHEDDAERAASAALRIVRLTRDYAGEIEAAWGIGGFNVRVGANTGRTLVGLVGAGAPQQVAFGDTTNVAAQLEAAAEPGTIVVGDGLARRLVPTFALEGLGPIAVKGRAEPVEAWRLLGPQGTLEVPEATPLVGRQRELRQLESVADALKVGRGQVLLIQGEGGLGKTRTLSELRSLVRPDVAWLEGRCRSYGGELPFWPFVEALRTWIGASEGDPELAVRTKLQARMDAILGEARARELFPYLGRLLFVRTDPATQETLQRLPPAELERGIRGACVAWIEALTNTGPVVLAVDDIHNADASTAELFSDLLPLADRAALLLVAAARPVPGSEGWRIWLRVQTEFRHRAVEMTLDTLSDEAASDLADALAPIGTLDPGSRRDIVARAEGNPLYVEELLRLLSESGGLERDGSGSLSLSRSTLILPPAVEGILVARIQQLPQSARRVAQIAAAVGRIFPVAVVERVADADGIDEEVGALLRAEVIREHRRYPEFECAFRHGLLRDAVLSTLTPARMKELSLQVAEALEELYADSLATHVERLAFNYLRGGNLGKALEHFERGVGRAAELNSPTRAGELLRRARRVAESLGDADAEGRIDRLLEAMPT